MKKKTIILAILICICFCGSACAQNADEKTSAAMAEFDWVMDEIGRLPGKIDEDICGGDMVIRHGRYGEFYACANYPTCTFTKQKIIETGVSCPICSSKIIGRHSKGKSLFYSCEKYPECSFSSWDTPLKEKCPDCGGPLYYRKSRKSIICKEKNCDYKREEELNLEE